MNKKRELYEKIENIKESIRGRRYERVDLGDLEGWLEAVVDALMEYTAEEDKGR